MTIEDQTLGSNRYIAESVGPFPIGFPITDETHIEVSILEDGETEATLKVLDTDYTVSEDLTTITLTTALADGEILAIRLNIPLTQPTKYHPATNSLKKRAEDVETSLDRITQQFIQVDDSLSRAAQLTGYLKASGTIVTLPNPIADGYIAYNALGTGLITRVFRTSGDYIEAVEDDLTPQLGGSLNTNNNSFTSTSNGDIGIKPNGTGAVNVDRRITLLDADASNGITIEVPESIDTSYTVALPSAGPSADSSLLRATTATQLGFEEFIAAGDTLLTSGSIPIGTTASTYIDILFDNYDPYTLYKIEIVGIKKAYGNLIIKTSSDGGATFDGGVSDYRFAVIASKASGSGQSTDPNGDDTHPYIPVGHGDLIGPFAEGPLYPAVDETNNYTEIYVYNPYDENRTVIYAKVDSAYSNIIHSDVIMGTRLSSTPVNAIRIQSTTIGFSTSLFLAQYLHCLQYRVWGIGGTGEYTNPSVPPFSDSLSFDGSGDYISISSANFGTFSAQSKVAVCFTAKAIYDPQSSKIIQYGTDAVTITFGRGGPRIYFNNSLRYTYDLGALAGTGLWNHFYIEIDSTQATADDRCKLYINGILQTARTVNSAITLNETCTVSSTSYIGGSTGTYGGYIYQPGIFKGTLPGISSVFDTTAGYPKDISGLSGLHSYLDGSTAVSDGILASDWTAVGSTTTSTTRPNSDYRDQRGSNSLDLTNAATPKAIHMSNSEFLLSSISGTKFGFSCWFKQSTTPTATFFGTGNNTTPTTYNMQCHRSSSTYYALKVQFTTAGTVELRSSSPTTDTASWHHLYFVVDTTQAVAADRMKIYEDGVIIDNDTFGSGTFPGLNDTCVWTVGTGKVSIGGIPSGSANAAVNALMYDMAFFDGSLGTLPTISELYSAGTSPNISQISSLKALWVNSCGTAFTDSLEMDGYLSNPSNYGSTTAYWQASATVPVTSTTIPTLV